MIIISENIFAYDAKKITLEIFNFDYLDHSIIFSTFNSLSNLEVYNELQIIYIDNNFLATSTT